MSASPTQPTIPEGPLIETHKGYQPRVVFFYFLLGLLITILAAGLAYRQIFQSSLYEDRERIQNQRRIVTPGPRGDILDREGRVLAGSRPQISVVLLLDELRSEFRREYYVIQNRYTREIEAGTPGASRPEETAINQMARADVVQRYVDQLNAITGGSLTLDRDGLERHFLTERLLPYVLVSDLDPGAYARLLDQLPIESPLQIYPTSERVYPYGSAAAHTIGSVRVEPNIETDYLGDGDLSTFKMPGIRGREGLEAKFDSLLQGKAGSRVLQVDPAGYPIDSPPDPEEKLPEVPARQGQPLVTSIDIDLQLAAEQAIGDQRGGAALLDVNTGEVLALVSKPNYDLNAISPRMSFAARDEIESNRAWQNLAVNGLYPPGSTFKILNAIAGLRAGTLTPDKVIVDCDGVTVIGGRLFYCDNGNGHHHEITLLDAIAQSCDIYFYEAARLTTPEQLAAEARRFHLDRGTGIQLPETEKMIIPDPEWAKREIGVPWRPGDTANMGIGQGYVRVTPLEMAAFVASVARNEVTTIPTLLHDPSAPRQHSESIGLTEEQRATLIGGMVGAVNEGTAKVMSQVQAYRIPGVQVAGKTGTAQVNTTIDGKVGTINIAWFICFAPAENPQVAMAVAIEGEELGESFYGGTNAVPVAATVLKKYFEKQAAR